MRAPIKGIHSASARKHVSQNTRCVTRRVPRQPEENNIVLVAGPNLRHRTYPRYRARESTAVSNAQRRTIYSQTARAVGLQERANK